MILNSDDLKKYYGLVNGFIDNYIEEYKISPDKLKKYLSDKNKFNNFVKRNNLEGIKNIERVITDVIDDRFWMYKDKIGKVKKFESFINESFDPFDGLEDSNIKHEKYLSNHFDVSLSSVSKIGDNNYNIELFNGDKKVYFYTGDDIYQIKINIKNDYLESFYKMKIELDGISLNISDITDKPSISENLYDKIDIQFISNYLKDLLECDNYQIIDEDNILIF
jgi:hypothetical protein